MFAFRYPTNVCSPLFLYHPQEAPMRFFWSVRTKETTNQELPEVPFRRSPGISTAGALPPLLVTNVAEGVTATVATSAAAAAPATSGSSDKREPLVTSPSSEKKLKLVKKVDEVSDKKRVVYMVQSATDNGPQISAAAAYSLLPHESTAAVGVNSPNQLPSSGGGGAKSAGKQQTPRQQGAGSEEGTPRYRSLVEKENAKMKKLMQSLSEEKKLLKQRKREAMKEAAVSPNTSSPSSTTSSLKMKITKSDTGLLVIQSSVDAEPMDVLSAIGSVANCDMNDVEKKTMFLKCFGLAPKKPAPSTMPEKKVRSSCPFFISDDAPFNPLPGTATGTFD